MQRLEQRNQHTLEIPEHVVVPESPHAISLGRKPTIAAGVTLRFGMLSAVDLNHQARVVTNEVRNKWSHRSLAAELEVGKASIAQREPKLVFGVGHAAAELACLCDRSQRG
jgi:hypothetical protein